MSKKGRLALTFLGFGHFISDSYSSSIYPLLPLLGEKLSLTQGQVFWLAPLLNITSSLMQPIYGFIADRYTRRAFAAAGPMITGLFVSLIGTARSYWMLVLFLVLGGAGIGAFHPQGAALAANLNKTRRRLALSIFASSGSFGFALGPIIIASIVGATDITKTYYMIPLGFVATALIFRYCQPPENSELGYLNEKNRLIILVSTLKAVWRPMLILYLITLARSTFYIMTNNYMPFVLKSRGYSLRETGAVLTIYLLAGALGSFAGGAFAERFSGRLMTLGTGLLIPPLLATAFLSSGSLSIFLLAAGAFILMSVLPVNIAMAQELAPRETSTVSALMMGLAWGVGAISPALFEPLTRVVGFTSVLAMMTLFPMLTSLLSFFLPWEERRGQPIEPTPLAASPFGD